MDAAATTHRMPRRRRAHARFEAALRVEYEVKQQRVLSLSRSMSAGGMLLGNTTDLQPHAELDFSILLPDKPREPLRVRGKVVGVTRRGAQVQFDSAQTQASLRIRRYVAEKVIPGLHEEVGRADAPLKRVLELAELLLDFGRTDEAMNVYRSKLLAFGRERAFCENMAVLWLDQLSTTSEGKRPPLLAELRDLCRRADEIKDSEVLQNARDRLAGKAVAPIPPAMRKPAPLEAEPQPVQAAPAHAAPRAAEPAARTAPPPALRAPPKAAAPAVRTAPPSAKGMPPAAAQSAPPDDAKLLIERLAVLEKKLAATTVELQRERQARRALEPREDDVFAGQTVITATPPTPPKDRS